MGKFKPGDMAYIVESNCIIREVAVMKYSGGMYLVKFTDKNGSATRVKEHRLFSSAEEAEKSIPKQKEPEPVLDYRHSPYYYDH